MAITKEIEDGLVERLKDKTKRCSPYHEVEKILINDIELILKLIESKNNKILDLKSHVSHLVEYSADLEKECENYSVDYSHIVEKHS